MPVRAYTRVSSALQLEGYSLDFQREKAEAWAAFHDEKPLYLYEERGLSGKRDDRPELLRLLAEVQAGDTVLVYSLSRLGRGGAVQLLGIVEELKAKQARLVSLTENLDTQTASGRLLLVILATIAELELETTRERTTDGRTQAAQSGVWPQAQRSLPYGYARGADGRIIEGEHADHLRLIFRLAAGGTSYNEVAAELRRRGIPTKTGGRWAASTVMEIIKADYYHTGLFTYRKALHPDAPEVWIPIPMPRLIDAEQWEAAQRPRSRNHPHRDPARYPFTGHAFCECGQALVGATTRRPGERRTRTEFRYYVCQARTTRAARCPVHNKAAPVFDAERVDRQARQALVAALQTPAAVAALCAQPTPPDDPHAEERARLDTRKRHLVDLYMDELVDRPEYVRRLVEIEARLSALAAPVPLSPAVPDDLTQYAYAAQHLQGEDYREFLNLLRVQFTVGKKDVWMRRMIVPE